MDKSELLEIKRGDVGTGLLIENDGYISMSDENNKQIRESFENSKDWFCPNPFIVHAVFQKYGIKNANGRIYPEDILKKQVELYQQRIKERRALGECYSDDAMILTKDGWKSIVDVNKGDLVITLNVETNQTEIKPILTKIEYDYLGEMVRLKGDNIDDLVTPNHRYPIYNKENATFQDFYTATDILNRNMPITSELYIPISNDIKQGNMIDETSINAFKEYYRGKVYCIEVENHTWYVKQNNKSHWTGNCNHPSESTIDLGRISHNIIELHWEGNTLVGQMELNLTNGFIKHGICSSLGDTVANLLLNGYKIGVSSRGVGSVEQRMGQYIVGNDFELICWDIVSDPSTNGSWISPERSELQQYVESKKYTNDKIFEKINKIKGILNK